MMKASKTTRIIKMEKLLRLRRTRQLTIEGKVLITSCGNSKIVYLSLARAVPSSTIAQLDKIQIEFIWRIEILN